MADFRVGLPGFLLKRLEEAFTMLSEPGMGSGGVLGEAACSPEAGGGLVASQRAVCDSGCLPHLKGGYLAQHLVALVAGEPVGVGQDPKAARAICDWRPGGSISHQFGVQGREVPGNVGEVLDQAAGAGQIPVRQPGDHLACLQEIPCRDVPVDDPAAAKGCGYWLDLPDRIGRRREVSGGVMEFTQQRGYLDELVVASQSGHRGARQQGEHVAAKSVGPQVSRRVSEALAFEMTKQRAGCVAGGPPRPADRVTDAPDAVRRPQPANFLALGYVETKVHHRPSAIARSLASPVVEHKTSAGGDSTDICRTHGGTPS
jgi:hypothetical protein